jgi:hypothetical protein
VESPNADTACQVRGKKNLVLERSLAGPLGLFVKFSTLQEYGVDRVFFLENDNVDSSQRNIIFLARGDKAAKVTSIAGMFTFFNTASIQHFPLISKLYCKAMRLGAAQRRWDILALNRVHQDSGHILPKTARNLVSLDSINLFGTTLKRPKNSTALCSCYVA